MTRDTFIKSGVHCAIFALILGLASCASPVKRMGYYELNPKIIDYGVEKGAPMLLGYTPAPSSAGGFKSQDTWKVDSVGGLPAFPEILPEKYGWSVLKSDQLKARLEVGNGRSEFHLEDLEVYEAQTYKPDIRGGTFQFESRKKSDRAAARIVWRILVADTCWVKSDPGLQKVYQFVSNGLTGEPADLIETPLEKCTGSLILGVRFADLKLRWIDDISSVFNAESSKMDIPGQDRHFGWAKLAFPEDGTGKPTLELRHEGYVDCAISTIVGEPGVGQISQRILSIPLAFGNSYLVAPEVWRDGTEVRYIRVGRIDTDARSCEVTFRIFRLSIMPEEKSGFES